MLYVLGTVAVVLYAWAGWWTIPVSLGVAIVGVVSSVQLALTRPRATIIMGVTIGRPTTFETTWHTVKEWAVFLLVPAVHIALWAHVVGWL